MTLKVLYHHRIASKDGMYVHVEELTNAMLEKGVTLEFVCPGFNEKSEFGSEGGFAARLRARLPAVLYELLELAYSLIVGFKLIRTLLRFKPDFIYERYNLYQPVGVIIAKLFRKPILLEVNAPLADERKKHNGLKLYPFAKWIEDFTWRHATYVLPVTDVLADYVRAAGVSESRIVVIPNGINQNVFDKLPRVSSGTTKDRIVIGFTGFINPWHRLDLALDAIAKHKDRDIRLVCVGDGTILPQLKAKAQQLGIADKVEFAGLVTRDKVFDYVAQFDITLQPDVTAYASPLKLFEYLAVGSLVIAPRTRNILEILSDDNALLFEPKNFDDFAAKLGRAIDEYEALMPLRQNAQQLIEQRGLTWQANADRVLQLARQALGR